MAAKPYIIALEEHYFDPEVKRHTIGQEPPHAPRIVERLDDVGEMRLREMDVLYPVFVPDVLANRPIDVDDEYLQARA